MTAWDPNVPPSGAWKSTPEEHVKYVWGGPGVGGAGGAGGDGAAGASSEPGAPAPGPSGRLLLMELDGLRGNAVLRKYTWGLDLAGQAGQVNSLESAGGIGGLLAVYDTNGTTTGANPEADDMSYAYLYNANGDVGQVVAPNGPPPSLGNPNAASASASLVARYEYDPYGLVIGPDTDGDGEWTDDAGLYASRNASRFSTKQWDDATGLGYWGYRYYSGKLGRWVSRDPIDEWGGLNLARYCSNSPLDRVDTDGRREFGGGVGGWIRDPHRAPPSTTPPPIQARPVWQVQLKADWQCGGVTPGIPFLRNARVITYPDLAPLQELPGRPLGGDPFPQSGLPSWVDIYLELVLPLDIHGRLCCQLSASAGAVAGSAFWDGGLMGQVRLVQPIRYRLYPGMLPAKFIPGVGQLLTLGAIEQLIDVGEVIVPSIGPAEEKLRKVLCLLIAPGRSGCTILDSELSFPRLDADEWGGPIKGLFGGDGLGR